MNYAQRLSKIERELDQLEDKIRAKNIRVLFFDPVPNNLDANGNQGEELYELDGEKLPLEEYLKRKEKKARAEGYTEILVEFGDDRKS